LQANAEMTSLIRGDISSAMISPASARDSCSVEGLGIDGGKRSRVTGFQEEDRIAMQM